MRTDGIVIALVVMDVGMIEVDYRLAWNHGWFVGYRVGLLGLKGEGRFGEHDDEIMQNYGVYVGRKKNPISGASFILI